MREQEKLETQIKNFTFECMKNRKNKQAFFFKKKT
jgi:hypothetical protein